MSHDDQGPQVSQMGRIAGVSARERALIVVAVVVIGALVVGLALIGGDEPSAGPGTTDDLAAGPSVSPTVAAPSATLAPVPSADAPIGGSCPTLDGWAATACEHRGLDGERFVYACPPDGEPKAIWGDGIYTDDSSVCTAAVHTGRITLDEGGMVAVIIRPGLARYEGVTRNGIASDPWDLWGGSFVVATPD